MDNLTLKQLPSIGRQNQAFSQILFAMFVHKCWAFNTVTSAQTHIRTWTILQTALERNMTVRIAWIRPTNANSWSSFYLFPSCALLEMHHENFVKILKNTMWCNTLNSFLKISLYGWRLPLPLSKPFFHLSGHYVAVVVQTMSKNNLTKTVNLHFLTTTTVHLFYGAPEHRYSHGMSRQIRLCTR